MKKSSPSHRNSFKVKSALVGVAVFIASLILAYYTISIERTRLETTLRDRTSQQVIDLSSHLQAEINANVFLANGLVAYIITHPVKYVESNDTALAALHKLSQHLKNVGIAPDNRITHVYPLKGNEGALGVYYPNIPEQWHAVKQAIDSKATVLAGPVPLKQGGVGLISRTPVFLDDGSYWGIISLVIDTEKLLLDIFNPVQKNETYFAIRGKDGLGSDGDIIYGDAGIFDEDSIKINVPVPGGTWQLAAIPKNGWDSNQKHLVTVKVLAVLVSLLLGVAAYLVQIQRHRTIYSEERLRTFLENTHDGVIVTDEAGIIHEFNPAAEDMFGYSMEEMVGSDIETLFPSRSEDGQSWFHEDTKLRKFKNGRQIRVRNKSGNEFPIEITIAAARIKGQPHFVGVIRDITERLMMEEKLRDLANKDGLTGALNRRAFLEYADKQFKLSQRNDHPLTILMMDLDHFKRINDTYGHHAGDLVLIETVKLIEKCLRETDAFGRFGGEEFIAILPETPLGNTAEVMERILCAIREAQIVIDDSTTISLTMSIGASERIQEDDAIEAAINRADQALYHAKATGRNRFMVYQEEAP